MDGEQWIDEYRTRLGQVRRRAAGAERELAAVAATGRSPDGTVSVTVDAAGGLRRVEFGPGAAAAGRDRLAAAVLAAARTAQAMAAERAAAALAGLAGPATRPPVPAARSPMPPAGWAGRGGP